MLKIGNYVKIYHPKYGNIKVRITDTDNERKRYTGDIERPRRFKGIEVFFDDAAYLSNEL